MTDRITLAGTVVAALAYLGILLLAFPIHTEAMGYPYSYGYGSYYYPQTYYYSYPQYYYPYYYDISYSYPYYYDYSYFYYDFYDFYDPYYYGGEYMWF